MKILFIFFNLICCLSSANDIFFSVNQEIQSFYLAPQTSHFSYWGKTELSSKGDYSVFDNLKLKLDASISSTLMKKQDQQSFLFNPSQLGLLASVDRFEFYLGGFTCSGDGADLNNIFDVVNASDLRNPFSNKALGSVGATVLYSLDWATIKFFYIPKNEKSLLPDTQSIWWPRTNALPVSNAEGTFFIPENMSYSLASQSEEGSVFKNNYGLTSKLNFSNFDLSLFYYSGAHQIPQVSPDFLIDAISITPAVGVVVPPLNINLLWYRSEHVGGGATVVLDDWIFKVFAKKQTDFLKQKQEALSMTSTIENSLNISNYSLRYFLQLNRKWRDSTSAKELETLMGFYDKSSALGFYLDLNSIGLLTGAIIYNEKDPSFLTSTSFEHKWTDQFKSKISLNVLSSSGSILADAFDQTDHVGLSLNYDF